MSTRSPSGSCVIHRFSRESWQNLRGWGTHPFRPSGINKICVQTYAEKRTVLLSTNLAWPAVAGCSRAETFSQLSAISFAQPCMFKINSFRTCLQSIFWLGVRIGKSSSVRSTITSRFGCSLRRRSRRRCRRRRRICWRSLVRRRRFILLLLRRRRRRCSQPMPNCVTASPFPFPFFFFFFFLPDPLLSCA